MYSRDAEASGPAEEHVVWFLAADQVLRAAFVTQFAADDAGDQVWP